MNESDAISDSDATGSAPDAAPEFDPGDWPLHWGRLGPESRWLWWQQLWADVTALYLRYRLPLRSGWWEDEIQVEALAALAAWVERYDSGAWDDPPGKLALLAELERIGVLLRDGNDPFNRDRDWPAFVLHVAATGAVAPEVDREPSTCEMILGNHRWPTKGDSACR